jgi:hypothetical protein
MAIAGRNQAMNLKIIFSLALVLWIPFGFSFADEAMPTNSTTAETATNTTVPGSKYNLKIVIIPSTTQIHIHDWSGYLDVGVMAGSVPITLRIENPTSTAQDVQSYNSAFDCGNWKFSNVAVCYANEPLGSKGNDLVLDKIPPGGALTHEDAISVLDVPLQNDLGNKISFRMGFNPGDRTKTFWSNEVVLDVVYDTWPSPSDVLMILAAILVLAATLIWWMARRICRRGKLGARTRPRWPGRT